MSLQLIFLGGKYNLETIAATAGNIVTNLSPGPDKRWLVLYGTLVIDTDGTAANRSFLLQITDGTNVIHTLCYGATITANQIGYLDMGPTRLQHGVVAGINLGNVNDYVGADPFIVEGNDQLRITVNNGVAGDSYSGYVLVLEITI